MKVELVLKQEHLRFLGYKLEVIVDCTGRINNNLKRPLSSIELPIQFLVRRQTRTVQQEEQQSERRDRNEQASNFLEQLIDKWICTNNKCMNHKGFCFIAFNRKHHSFDTT